MRTWVTHSAFGVTLSAQTQKSRSAVETSVTTVGWSLQQKWTCAPCASWLWKRTMGSALSMADPGYFDYKKDCDSREAHRPHEWSVPARPYRGDGGPWHTEPLKHWCRGFLSNLIPQVEVRVPAFELGVLPNKRGGRMPTESGVTACGIAFAYRDDPVVWKPCGRPVNHDGDCRLY